MLDQLDDADVPVLVLGEGSRLSHQLPPGALVDPAAIHGASNPPVARRGEYEQVAVAAIERAAIDRDSQAVYVDAIPAFCDDECRTYRDRDLAVLRLRRPDRQRRTVTCTGNRKGARRRSTDRLTAPSTGHTRGLGTGLSR